MVFAAALTLGAAAQTKAEKAIQKKLDKSDVAIENPKKAGKVATWLDRSDLYMDAAMVFTKNLIANIPAAQLTSSSIAGEPKTIEEVTIGQNAYSKYVYPQFDVYVNMNGMVEFWSVKKEMIPDAMFESVAVLAKAKEVDEEAFMKSSKAKKVAERITAEMSATGQNNYRLEDYSLAGKDYNGAFAAQELIGNFDTISCYYSGICYVYAKEFDKALPVFEKLVSVNYLEEGQILDYLAICQKETGDVEGSVKTYEEAFKQFPTSTAVMGGLINAYMAIEKSPEDIVILIKQAEEIDPTNVSLYLVEADIWKKAGNQPNAYLALDKAIEVAPDNVVAYFNYAVHKVLESDEIVGKAQKLDNNDVKGYNDLITKAENLRKESVALLEKAVEIDPSNTASVDLLGQMYFICRDLGDEYAKKNEEFKAKYNK